MTEYFDTPDCCVHLIRPSSERSATIREIFGLTCDDQPMRMLDKAHVPLHGITLIMGVSGAGKSMLLRRIAEYRGDARLLAEISDWETPMVDLLGTDVPEAIRWMSRFGLGDARLMTMPYQLLSEGQKVRARLALLMWGRPSCIIIDEFLSLLDRQTARIVAYNVQKICRTDGVAAYLATAHTDLTEALAPDHVIDIKLGGYTCTTSAREHLLPILPELQELEVGPGTPDDYRALARFHYVEHLAAETPLTDLEWEQSVTQVRVARFQTKVVACAVFARPFPRIMEKMPFFAQINRRATVLLRIVVHPIFRGLGLTKLLSTPDVSQEIECIVVCSRLGMFFPFCLGAGFDYISHPRSLRYPDHDDLDALLLGLSTEEKNALHRYESAQRFYNSLSEDRRSEIRRVSTNICVKSNIDYCKFFCELLGVSEGSTESLQDWLLVFFETLCKHVPDSLFGAMLSEALYFPVQGFIRRLQK